jgi:hypothetical protein
VPFNVWDCRVEEIARYEIVHVTDSGKDQAHSKKAENIQREGESRQATAGQLRAGGRYKTAGSRQYTAGSRQ